MSIARRPLLTAIAAGILLCALWFVPSAKTAGGEGRTDGTESVTTTDMADVTTLGTKNLADDGDSAPPTPASTAGITPYVLGGTILLGLGAGSVTLATRRVGGTRT
ncbi:hypothetical protein [Streptomyces laurentii]|uniref:hypothetical protein n=1 Tax=Streptomyces laurentii TaxID=39478 RepID=UPI0036BC24EF